MKKLMILLILLSSCMFLSCSSSSYCTLKTKQHSMETNQFFNDYNFDLTHLNSSDIINRRFYYFINRDILYKYNLNYNSIYDYIGPHYIYDVVGDDLVQLEDYHYYFTKDFNVLCSPFVKQEYKIIPSNNERLVEEILEKRYQNDRVLKKNIVGVYKDNDNYYLNNLYRTIYNSYVYNTNINSYDDISNSGTVHYIFDRNIPINSFMSVFNLNISNHNTLCVLFIPNYYDLLDVDISTFDSYYYETDMKLINNEIEEYDLKIYLKYNNKDYLINQLSYLRDVTHDYYYANYEIMDPNNYPKYDKDGSIYHTTYIPFEFYLNNEDKLIEYAETFKDNMRRIMIG